eukprot:scaffold308875_cov18-Prasinocladus_malaysianus.AAC.1
MIGKTSGLANCSRLNFPSLHVQSPRSHAYHNLQLRQLPDAFLLLLSDQSEGQSDRETIRLLPVLRLWESWGVSCGFSKVVGNGFRWNA